MKTIKKNQVQDVVVATLLAKDWYPDLFFKQQIYIQPDDYVVVKYHDYNLPEIEYSEHRLEGKQTLAICKSEVLSEVAYEFMQIEFQLEEIRTKINVKLGNTI
jgi:hypothetical protein